jgi:hypothetical protein
MWWTYSTPATDTVNDTCYTTWIPNLPDRRYYEVFTFIPSHNAVASAKYRIYHDLGVSTVTVRQNDYSDVWVSLGTYACESGAGSRVYLGDGTGTSAEYIGFDAIKWSRRATLPAPDTLVQLMSDGFRWGGPINYRHIVSGGFAGTFYWTYSEASGSDVNSGTWRPNLPSSGEYDVYAFIPASHATANATYHIHHSSGDATMTIAQNSYSDIWVLLGRYNFNSGTGGYVFMGDVTGTGSQQIGFDAIVWRHVVPVVVAENIVPEKIALKVYPNPFNSSCRIESNSRIEIFDLSGKLVRNFSGNSTYLWDGSDLRGKPLSSGLYFLKATSANDIKTIEVFLSK